MNRRTLVRAAMTVLLAGMAASPALALPTMIRLGYTNCAACHLSPQGGGLLNDYGRAVDQAQSLRGGEYERREGGLVTALSWNGRITQDFRLVMQEQVRFTGRQSAALFRPRLSYRNDTQLGKALRISAVITGETESAPRPSRAYEPANAPADAFVNSALIGYRLSDSFEIAAGRDQLPTGVNVPDLGLFVRSRNRLGYYDSPAQVKMFWLGPRHQVSPFAFGPSGNEPSGDAETGAGTLAEFDLFGKQKTVVGMTLLRAASNNGDRTVLGGYARLGFGRWGVLAEHEVTDRSRVEPEPITLRQQATYAQVFVAVREWLVASAIGERLKVTAPFGEDLAAGKFELAARLAGEATLTFGTRIERDKLTGRAVKSLVLQAAFKTVN